MQPAAALTAGSSVLHRLCMHVRTQEGIKVEKLAKVEAMACFMASLSRLLSTRTSCTSLRTLPSSVYLFRLPDPVSLPAASLPPAFAMNTCRACAGRLFSEHLTSVSHGVSLQQGQHAHLLCAGKGMSSTLAQDAGAR